MIPIAARVARYQTLNDALAAAPPTKPFVTMWDPRRDPQEVTVTFRQFRAMGNAFAAIYEAHGLRPGDSVVLIVEQSLELLAAFAGALLAGTIPAILASPTFKVDPDKYRTGLLGVTRNLGAKVVVLGQEFPETLLPCVAGTRTIRLGTGVAFSPIGTSAPPAVDPDHAAFIQHSAGTTGLQKGVALSHRAVLSQLVRLTEAVDLREGDRIVSWLPLYHDMGLIACFVLPLVAHLPLVLQSPTSWVMWPDSFLRLACAHRCTLCWLPNFAFQFLARRVGEGQRRSLDLSAMRAIINCSEPVRPESMNEFYEVFVAQGLRRAALQSSYALAENTFAVTQSRWTSGPTTLTVDEETLSVHRRVSPAMSRDLPARTLASSGVCLRDTGVRVVDDAGRILPPGSVGELWIESPSLFEGYHNRPDLTAQALHRGWYRTGDLGFVWNDELYVLGRKDDVIIVGGRNLYPQDLEETAATNPYVHDGRVVAFGMFNPETGTDDLVVVAEFNEGEDPALAPMIQADIRRKIFAEAGVSPRFVYLVPPKWIVKSTAGKPARSATREKLAREHLMLSSGGRAADGA